LTALDVGIVVFMLGMAALGWELGLVRSALPLAGFVAGAVIGGRIGPAILAGGTNSAYAPVASLVGGLVGGGLLAGALDAVGFGLRRRLGQGRGVMVLDGLGGAVLLGVLALLVAWAVGAVVREATAPGNRALRSAIEDSAVISELDRILPPSGPILNLLRRVDPVPTVEGPSARVAAPSRSILRAPAVGAAGRSAVRVVGTACALGVEGSGWVAGPDLVVTNAHVVAGEDNTTVSERDGRQLAADVVHYDPRNDIAILRVPGLRLPALELEPHPRSGTPAAVLGYPENGPFKAAPARLGRAGDITTQDAYGRGPIRRRIVPFRGAVLPGDSGSAAVDANGRVETTVFAATESSPNGGLGVPNAIVRAALAGPLRPTGTGACG
jgi:S1-C subfamily serine protease